MDKSGSAKGFPSYEEHSALQEANLASDYVKTSKYTELKTGKTIEVPLKVVRLKPDAIPSVFPNCPQYLSRQNACTREALEEKKKAS
ncbi:hypothetical protein HPB51_017629 [Rhipicephalus microplus]|uniref:Uncharacterized protein n=1 Tax=Rhipicephalus microplus TaxID=6941 RepID=A0A9J6EHQ4_RHIMP|nr:hypothetical protein HPB51_017629 [Rhipicephalus microplus]